MGPEAVEIDVGLWKVDVSEQEPGTEDWLGENVKDGVGDDFLINVHVAATVGDAPDDWVDGPDDQSKGSNGSEKAADLATLGSGGWATVKHQLPNYNKVGDASNGIPAPLLGSTLGTESGEETSQDHDQIGDDGDENAATVHAGQKSQIEEQEWSGDGPVNIAGPEDLAVDVVGGVWDVLVRLAGNDMVPADSVASGHGEVGDGGRDGNQSGDDMVETLGHWNVPRHAGEDDRGDDHDNEDDP